jgi:hypothetical protein
MHVTRKTNQELVILDSSIWISVSLLCVSLFVAYRVMLQHNPRSLLPGGLFLIFVLLFWRKEVVVFDAAAQKVTWTRRRLFKVATGTIPFSDISGVGMETSTAKNNVLVYRLAILTTQGSVPMADNYAGDQMKYEKLRKEILEFLKLDPNASRNSSDSTSGDRIDDDASVRALLRQGRRIDAIQLVRATQNLSLTEAHDRVTALQKQLNSKT